VKARVRGPKFSEHYNQATLFWNSMSPVEQQHIIEALSFELGKVDDNGIQTRMVEQLNMVDNKLAVMVARSLSIEEPKEIRPNHGKRSDYLSMLGPHNRFTASGRKLGVYVLDEFDYMAVTGLKAALVPMGVIVMIVGPRKNLVKSGSKTMETQFTFETCRSTHFDAVFFAGGAGDDYLKQMSRNGRLLHAAREAFMHYKTVAAEGNAVEWLRKFALPGEIDALAGQVVSDGVVAQQGIVLAGSSITDVAVLIKSLTDEMAKHRAWGRDVSAVPA
ncbi:hypothetical protein FRC02_010452, partial [Tulasnella sp. 418]